MIKLSGLVLDKDITIVFTKPRPGEKLFEEMLTAEEGTSSTQNKNIFIAKLSHVNSENLTDKINNLKKSLNNLNKGEIVSLLKEFIPQYKPKV